MPGFGRRRRQLDRGEVTALLAGEPLAELNPAGLLEQIDHGLAVAPDGEHAARVGQIPRRADPVGQVGLRRGAAAHVTAQAAEQVDVAAGQMRRVHDSAARAERSGLRQHLGRGGPVCGQAGTVLRHLLGEVRVQRCTVTMRPRHDPVHLLERNRADRVDRGAGPGSRAESAAGIRAELVDPGRPGRGVPVAEPQLRPFQRLLPAVGRQAAG